MLRFNEHPQTRVNVTSDPEISRILSAAVINKRFRSALLNSPESAISQGYCGEPFRLSSEQKKRIAGIRKSSLEAFAAQLAQI